MLGSGFIDPKTWKNIKRRYFYQAAMYYLSDTEQPLRFIEKDSATTYKITRRPGDFRPKKIAERNRAVEQEIAITLKPRQVIVISNDQLNQREEFGYVQVLTVFSLTRRHSKKAWYQYLINDRHPGFVFIRRRKGYGVSVDLTQVSIIHKSLLLKEQSKVPSERMHFIESRLLELLDL